MSTRVYFVTHPDVVIDPNVPVPQWRLSERGRSRMRALLEQPWVGDVSAVFCSTEQKAIDGVEILANRIGISYETVEQLGENDRSATGYLPKEEFRKVADEFFARPQESVRGWERAVDAQTRIVRAVAEIAERDGGPAIAVVSHGGVGTLLLCHLKRVPINPAEEQPGTAGGNYFVVEWNPMKLVQGWKPIDV